MKLIVSLLCLSPLWASALDIQTHTLKNGLQVAVVEDSRTPIAVHSVWYRAGSADEPTFADDKGGIAHMLEHLMFKGQPSAKAGEFSRIVARLGGQDNAFTSRDMTAYWQRIGANQLESVMRLEAERMHRLDISGKTFLPERDVVREERRLRVETKPIPKFFEDLVKTHFGKHPYSQPVIGSAEEIMNFTLEDAERWYNQHYAPNNAILLVVGDVNATDVFMLAEQYYGVIQAVETPSRNWQSEPPFSKPRVLDKINNQVEVPLYYRLYRVPSAFNGVAGSPAPDLKTVTSLMLLANILGHSSRGHLYKTLVEKQKLATAASINYSAVLHGETSLDLFMQPAPEVNLKELRIAAEKELLNFTEIVSEADLKRTKTALRAAWLYAQDDPYGIAYRLGRWLIVGGDANSYDDWLQVMETISLQDIINAHQKYLLNNNQYTSGRLVQTTAQLGE